MKEAESLKSQRQHHINQNEEEKSDIVENNTLLGIFKCTKSKRKGRSCIDDVVQDGYCTSFHCVLVANGESYCDDCNSETSRGDIQLIKTMYKTD